jgi:uncharacterized RDD family membrane protein YckC
MNAIAQPSPASLSGSKLDNRRMLAALIDLAVVGVGAAAIVSVAGSVGAPLVAVIAGWALYYYFACESGGGQTLGKRLLGLRVVMVDGRTPGMRDVAVRTVLRLVDTALIGLVSMLATGERRARLGDLAAGTMIVTTDTGPKPAAAAAVAAPAAAAPVADEAVADETETEELAEPEAPPVPEMRPFEPETDPTPYRPVLGEGFEDDPAEDESAEDEPVADEPAPAAFEPAVSEPVAVEPVADEPAAEVDEPVVELFQPSGGESAEGPPAAVEPGSAPVELTVVEPPVVEPPAVELSVVEAPPAADHSLDIATPSLKELAQDVRAAKEPVVEVEVAGPEVDVDGPDMTVRSVETVSAIDLIMGGDEPVEDAPADEQPPATA